ncbi:MAG: hypothetical protein ACQESR_10125 [Planctomycetota bacterium]
MSDATRSVRTSVSVADAGPRNSLAVILVVLALAAARFAWAQGYLGPSDVVVGPESERLYVACSDAQQVLWIALPGGEIQRRVDVPAPATGMALRPARGQLFVTCAAPQSSVLQLDVETGEVMRTMMAGHTAGSPVLDPSREQLFVCNRFSNDVSVIELASGSEIARVGMPREPVSAALTPDGHQLVVANHLPHRSSDPEFEDNVNAVVTLVDTSTYETTNIELYTGATGLRGICVTPDGRHALVTHVLSNFENVPFRVDMGWINVNVVGIVDLHEMKTVTTIGLDELYQGSANPWGIACGSDGKTVWVSSAGTHEVHRIAMGDLMSDRARKTMSPLPGAWPVYPSLGETMWNGFSVAGTGPRALAIEQDSVYVAEYYSDSVGVISFTDDGEPTVRSISLGKTPDLTPRRKGNLLFNDARLCYQQWQSCASCHPDGRTDGLNWDLMNDGVGNPKNSKSMLLSHETPPAMITGVRATAEIAVRSGIAHILFATRPEAEAEAIDAYLKSLRPVPSPYLVNGQLSESARRGKQLFHGKRVGCRSCHPPPRFTDMRKHRMSSGADGNFDNAFDTPTLVEAWRTAPYLHNGQYVTIQELLLEGKHGLRPGMELSEQEIDDLAEYVLSL